MFAVLNRLELDNLLFSFSHVIPLALLAFPASEHDYTIIRRVGNSSLIEELFGILLLEELCHLPLVYLFIENLNREIFIVQMSLMVLNFTSENTQLVVINHRN